MFSKIVMIAHNRGLEKFIEIQGKEALKYLPFVEETSYKCSNWLGI